MFDLNHDVPVSELPPIWRSIADFVDGLGNKQTAEALRFAATQLELSAESRSEELLTPKQAAEEGGYTPDHIRRMVREGKLENRGRSGAPLIARKDVPKKAGTVASSEYIPSTQIVRSVID